MRRVQIRNQAVIFLIYDDISSIILLYLTNCIVKYLFMGNIKYTLIILAILLLIMICFNAMQYL